MRKTITRATAFVLTMAMCLSMVMTSAFALDYSDVSSSKWYYNAINYVSDKGYMIGVGDDAFSPETTLTRGMFVTVLYRMSPDYGNYSGVSTQFTDVSTGKYYSAAIAWAADKGITRGTSDTTFAPNDAVTREQMATFINRYLAAYGINLAESESATESFKDASSVSNFAKSSVEAMRIAGIILGDTSGNCNPQNNATRAEAAMIFWRLDTASVVTDSDDADEAVADEDVADDQDADTSEDVSGDDVAEDDATDDTERTYIYCGELSDEEVQALLDQGYTIEQIVDGDYLHDTTTVSAVAASGTINIVISGGEGTVTITSASYPDSLVVQDGDSITVPCNEEITVVVEAADGYRFSWADIYKNSSGDLGVEYTRSTFTVYSSGSYTKTLVIYFYSK